MQEERKHLVCIWEQIYVREAKKSKIVITTDKDDKNEIALDSELRNAWRTMTQTNLTWWEIMKISIR